MKKLLLFAGLLWSSILHPQVAITPDGSQPDSSAMLDIKSTAKGMLIPRLTSVQRQAIVKPAVGLMVFDSDKKAFLYYSGSGWTPIATGDGGSAQWKLNTAGTDFWDSAVTTVYTDSAFIGIGTHTPFSPLNIATKDFTWGLTHTNGSVRVGTFVGDGGGWIATATPSPLYFGTSELFTNVDPQMTLTTAGTLGINSLQPNPGYKLDVFGGILSESNLDCSAKISALNVAATQTVTTNQFSGQQLTLSGSSQALNFKQPVGTWTIGQNSNGNLQFSYTDIKNNQPIRVLFEMTTNGSLKGVSIGTTKANTDPAWPGLGDIAHQTAHKEGSAVQNESGTSSGLGYYEFSMLAIRAIRQQQAQIKEQQDEISRLTDRLEALEKKVVALK